MDRFPGFGERRRIQYDDIVLSHRAAIQIFKNVSFHKLNPVLQMIQHGIRPALIQCRLGDIDRDHALRVAQSRVQGKTPGMTETVEHPLAMGHLPQQHSV